LLVFGGAKPFSRSLWVTAMKNARSGRLDSWKEIADYLRRDVTTVIRWERDKGLPIHRVPGGKRQAVFAFIPELDAWLRNEHGQMEAASVPGVQGAGAEVEGHNPELIGGNNGGRRAEVSPISVPSAARVLETAFQPSRASTDPISTPASTRQIPRAVGKPVPEFAHFQLRIPIPRAVGRFRFALAVATASLTVALVYWLTRPLPPLVVAQTRQLTHDSLEKRGPLLTDGPRLYFQEKRGDRWVLISVLAAGGEPIVVPVPSPGVTTSDISADGAKFLGCDASENLDRIIDWPVTGGPAEYVGSLRGTYPAWSPDGSHIAYIDAKHRLVVANRHGEAPREVDLAAGVPWYPHWSPDGSILRFSVQEPKSETSSLWEVKADGSNPRRVAFGAHSTARGLVPADWMASSGHLLFSLFGTEVPSPNGPPAEGWPGIWAVSENCGLTFWRCHKLLPVATGPMGFFAPLPSRDGKSIFAIESQSVQQLDRYDRRSGSFTPYLAGVPGGEVDFSRDGRWVAYVREPDHTLWRSRVDGSERRQLSSFTIFTEARRPHWSPDGSEIAFMAVLDGERLKAYAVPAAGGVPQPLVEGDGEEGVPTWSPDGKSLVWGEPLHRRPPSEMMIHQLDLTTHRITNLPGSTGLWTARWSPGGRYVAASSVDQAMGLTESLFPGSEFRPSGLWLFDVGSKQWALLVPRTHVNELMWAKDGKFIYFDTLESSRTVYRVRTADRHVEPIISLSSLSSDSEWAGLTPDGSPLVTHSFNVQEVYAMDLERR
jgi:Tol biopolymer transport system component